ncbi:MAG: arginine N-succinyltransferase [Halobacteria archaeon]|nr:arginine N-succinyltransferase [Halobacteria archaeon]
MNTNTQSSSAPPQPWRFSTWQVATFVLLAILLTLGITVWAGYRTLFPGEFTPVTLNAREQRILDEKLQHLEGLQGTAAVKKKSRAASREATLEPEPYSEAGASREISLSEKELNALLATNTNLASRLAIDLSDDLASAKLLVPVDPSAPLLGGKTIKLTAGVEVRYAEGKPMVVLKGVSVWGVPLPNAWLGGMKNIDLVQEFGTDQGFWQAFAEGVEETEVKEGRLRIRLKE